jgi:hypothetical protein
MDIGADQITNVIVASTTDYIVEYSSVFLLIGGLVLALGVIGALLDIFTNDIPVQERNGKLSTEMMLRLPQVYNDRKFRKYVKSKYYPGSPKFQGWEEHDAQEKRKNPEYYS